LFANVAKLGLSIRKVCALTHKTVNASVGSMSRGPGWRGVAMFDCSPLSRVLSTPNASKPALLFAWKSGRAIIMLDLDEARFAAMAPPAFGSMKYAVASIAPAFLVMAARYRTEENATRLERRAQFPQNARQLAAGHVKERRVRENAVKIVIGQIELEKIL
jgi:hypothetical protein